MLRIITYIAFDPALSSKINGEAVDVSGALTVSLRRAKGLQLQACSLTAVGGPYKLVYQVSLASITRYGPGGGFQTSLAQRHFVPKLCMTLDSHPQDG